MAELTDIKRPMPPPEILLAFDSVFAPAPEVLEWLASAFLNEDSPLWNVEHDHLNSATIGVLWTNVGNSKNMKRIVGQAEIPRPQGGKWQKERALFQLQQWFGADLDFLITLDANYAAGCSDAQFCALVDHELYHCAQLLDEFGCPAFTQDGDPKFGLKGHDVEEFVGIVRRYGAENGAGATMALVDAAGKKPEIAAADISGMCGTCLSR